MADYTLEHKKSFTLTAYGFSIQSNFQDVPALQKEKAEFWRGLKVDGRFDKLKDAAMTIANGQSTRYIKANRGIISR